MAITQKKNDSTYAGFLNGYIAGNLAANAPELHLHTDRILQFVKELKADMSKWVLTDDQSQKWPIVFNRIELNTPIANYSDSTNNYLKLGEALYELVSFAIEIKPILPSTANFTVKKIIYHFLNIAKTAKDTGVTNQAQKIAEKFEVSGN